MPWNHASRRKCIGVSDVLSKLQDAGVSLRDTSTLKTVDQLLDYGEQVVNDDALWATVPEQVVPSAARQQRMKAAAASILSMAAQPKPKKFAEIVDALDKIPGTRPTSAGMNAIVAEASLGISRDELRQDLRDLLDASR